MDGDMEEALNEEIDSDEWDEREKALELEVINLENKIAENEFAYQPYLDLIKVLKSLVDLDRLRSARKKMANRFPLSPDLWIDWLQDEINLATSLEEKEQIVDLFQAAVKDYLSVEIWLQYIKFYVSLNQEKNSSDINSVRNIFENALTAAGLHVRSGSLIWDSFLDYEKSILISLSNNSEEYKNQLKRIANLYKRQLSCPLLNMEKTFENFEKWLLENSKDLNDSLIDQAVVENIYKKAKEKLSKIMPFEDALVSNPENTLEIWKNYLEHEKSKEGSPVRVQCLYERILCDNCLREEIWLEYIEYINTVLHNPEVVLTTCKRATRNCPWCCKIYQTCIKCLEKYEFPQKNITEVVEEAFASGLQTASDFRDVWMTYLEYLRRSFDSSGNKEEEEKRLKDLRAAFCKAEEFIMQMRDADPEYTVLQFWARVEAIYCKNMEKSRELWNVILSDERSKTAEMWSEYIHLERTFGDSKHLRKLFPRALQNANDYPELIGKIWLNYERDEGTLDSFENCVRKIEERMKKVMEERKRNSIALISEPVPDYPRKKSKKMGISKEEEKFEVSRSASNSESKKIMGYKRKHVEFDDDGSPTKKNKSKEIEGETEEDNDQFVKRLVNESKKLHGETVVHESSKDDRTVFVSNLDFSTEESAIRELFNSCGHLTDLRLVRDYRGRSKGYCYVEFEKSKEAELALKKDRELIDGRPVFVSKCDPDKETRSSGFKYSCGLEKNKLFVRGLPFTTTVDDLKNLFLKFGSLKDVRLVTYRNGHSKGLAYVDFEDEASAAQAILSTDGTIIDGKQISVAISNPPSRKAEGMQSVSNAVLSLGGGHKEMGPRGKSKTQISFLPRSVTLKKSMEAADSMANLSLASPLPEKEQKKLSNSDFRKLIG